jgi:hypothetical protein
MRRTAEARHRILNSSFVIAAQRPPQRQSMLAGRRRALFSHVAAIRRGAPLS